MRRLVLDLNWGGRMKDGRGITTLVKGERRNGRVPDDLREGEALLLADYDELPDGSPVFEEMTGYTPPEEEEWWSNYKAHVQRRHRIVHTGARVTRADAESSISAAEAMIAFLYWPVRHVKSRGGS